MRGADGEKITKESGMRTNGCLRKGNNETWNARVGDEREKNMM